MIVDDLIIRIDERAFFFISDISYDLQMWSKNWSTNITHEKTQTRSVSMDQVQLYLFRLGDCDSVLAQINVRNNNKTQHADIS